MVTPVHGAPRRSRGPSVAFKIGFVVLGAVSLAAGVYAATTHTGPSWSGVALIDIGVVFLAITAMTLWAGRQEGPFRAWALRGEDAGSPPRPTASQPAWMLGIHMRVSVGLFASGVPGVLVADPPVGFVLLAFGSAVVQGAVAVLMFVASRAMARTATAARFLDDTRD